MKNNILRKSLPYIISVVIGISLYALVNVIFHPVIVSGNSMNPSLSNWDILISEPVKEPSDISRGDIVTYKNYDNQLIKRVVAIGGDTVQIADGVLFINGVESNYPLIYDAGYIGEPLTLQNDEYFCMGDNVNYSCDSRITGPIKFDQIISVIKGR